MTLILVLIACIIGYFLIKFWIRLINFIFKPIEKALEKNQEKIKPNQTKIEKVIKGISTSNFGEIDVQNLPGINKNKSFYFYEYEKQDGEWINVNEPICKIRIGEYSERKFESVLASKSGILEQTSKKDDLLKEETSFYKIHNKGEYQFENSIEKSEYKDYFKTSDHKNSFDKWFINDGDFVNVGDKVYQFNDSHYKKHLNHSKKAGYIHQIDPNKIVKINEDELMYIVRDTDEQRIKEKFINKPNLIIDDFTNATIIKWHKVSSRYDSQGIKTKSDNFITDFLFSFNFIDNNDFIVFHFDPKQIRPKQFDKVSFLFENGEQIEFELATNPIISAKNKMNEKILEYKGIITQSELELFASTNFKKWKISLVSDNREILGGETSEDEFYQNKNNIQIVIKKFASEYIDLVKNKIPNYQPTILKQSKPNKGILTNFCFVYLMQDTTNGHHKIGISNNPEYRERTLQSEKPTIEMIASKKFPIRKIAESIEKALHDTYSDKRLRGEWFELDTKDVEHIKESLK